MASLPPKYANPDAHEIPLALNQIATHRGAGFVGRGIFHGLQRFGWWLLAG